MAKTDLSATYGDEAKKFRELYEKGTLRTTTGSGSYTSLTSTIVYAYTAGDQDLFLQLGALLSSNNIIASDWNAILTNISSLQINSVGSIVYSYKNLGGTI